MTPGAAGEVLIDEVARKSVFIDWVLTRARYEGFHVVTAEQGTSHSIAGLSWHMVVSFRGALGRLAFRISLRFRLLRHSSCQPRLGELPTSHG